jgi:hypothetical protein
MREKVKYGALFVCLVVLTYVAFQYFKPRTCSMGRPPIEIKAIDVSAVNTTKDIDRQPIVRETPELLPANEIINMNFKAVGETGLDKEFYSSDAPLFNLSGPVNLTPLDINGPTRRVNFY